LGRGAGRIGLTTNSPNVPFVELDRRHVEKARPFRLVVQDLLQHREGVLASEENVDCLLVSDLD